MSKNEVDMTKFLYRKRLQTLLSSDDLVDRLIKKLDELNMTKNTYVFLTSDHGHHLGLFGLLKGKSQPYEEDIRVPFYGVGPTIPAGKK